MDIARNLALKGIYKINTENAYSNIVLDEILKNNREKLNEKDIKFISELIYGVTTWKLTLDTIIQKYSNIKIKKMSDWVINILRLGTYQIIFLDKVPKSAAVNESVNLCKKFANKSSGFVNAILRKISKDDYEELKKINDNKERISRTTSMPLWIIEELLKDEDVDKVEEICNNLNLKPNITIRINSLKTNKNELKEKLKNKNIIVEDGKQKDFLYLKNIKNITDLDEYKKGLFTLQDESAGFTAIILEPKEGEKVLDACSSPGGKTTYIAELMQNRGEILAWDLHKYRIKKVDENAKRLGIDIIKTEQNDASILNQNYIEKFDKILIDVPCLGIGVIKRKPDIKWQRKKEDIKEIIKIQMKILETCSKYLKKEGILVYSTCSIISSENDKIIQEFIKNNKNFEILETKKIYPDKYVDGFFMSKIKRI